ncbi:DinB family protein [Burkholderia seminalis]|uniref:DinB family protein n=1 Tax=Burkholderia seminalis TaxID=488731 RepID=UPI001453E673|nr:DinB family protein [Burkholderia seminalis]MCA8430409.1 DinB family protein [Burkholderia seminalis]VWB60551.1 DNA damage-inducible protein DinB [Burkholderia seminalis]
MTNQFEMLARWTAWANERMYQACAGLSSDEYFLARACAFGSIHHTLNHLLATDRIWLGRLSGEGHAIPALDFVVCDDFDSLRTERRAEDERLARIVGAVARNDLNADVNYTSMDGTPQRKPLGLVLSHLFLHHAHHRGQVHALLSQTPVAPPALDITYFPLG